MWERTKGWKDQREEIEGRDRQKEEEEEEGKLGKERNGREPERVDREKDEWSECERRGKERDYSRAVKAALSVAGVRLRDLSQLETDNCIKVSLRSGKSRLLSGMFSTLSWGSFATTRQYRGSLLQELN